MKYRRQVAETAEGATRHLLANLGDSKALADNPLVARLLDGSDGRLLRDPLAAIQLAVDRALVQLLDQAPQPERDIARRYCQILLKYDIRGESRKAVASDLGISERQMFRDRKLGCKRLGPLIETQLRNLPAWPSYVTDAYRLEYDYCEMMRRLGNPIGAGMRLRALGAATDDVSRRIFAWFRAADAFIDAEERRAVDEVVIDARRALIDVVDDASPMFEAQCIELLEARRLFYSGSEREAIRLAEQALPRMRESATLGKPYAFETYVSQCIYVAEWYDIFSDRHRIHELHEHARQQLQAHFPILETTQLYLKIEDTFARFAAEEEGDRRLIECLDAATRLREPRLVALTYHDLFKCRMLHRDQRGARDLLRRAIDAYELAGDSQAKHLVELQLALLESQNGDPDLALSISARVARSLSPHGYFGIAVPLCAGTALFRKGEFERAREEAALVLAESYNRFDKVIDLRSLVLLANCQMRLGHDSRARESIGDALYVLSSTDGREVYPYIAALVYRTAATITHDLCYRLKAREVARSAFIRSSGAKSKRVTE